MRVSAWRAATILTILAGGASTPIQGSSPAPNDLAELARLFQEDQGDRKPGIHGIDWALVKPRDDARLARVRELYKAGALKTGADWFRAAMILQHGNDEDDFLLAHEMCVAAVIKGETSAASLAAASEDRYLRKIGRPQRFGTQWEPGTEPGTFRLAPIDSEMTDELRQVLGVPSLAEAKASEGQFNKK
jgi:hypothetical protein